MNNNDFEKHQQEAHDNRSPEIEAAISALIHVGLPALENASDRDLWAMSHAVELIQREINFRFFIKMDCRKVRGQWFTDSVFNTRKDERRRRKQKRWKNERRSEKESI